MSTILLSLFNIVLLIVVAYGLRELFSGIWLVARYEHFDLRTISLFTAKALFIALCIGLYFLIKRAAKRFG
ncbi:hypothetical protein [Kalamiella sp. sgz302252]|uniref:hypothetical protein n=1 Tax=Pantoea sp. sgz302252 TaxID=3341827 RepID=UPI0036D31668